MTSLAETVIVQIGSIDYRVYYDVVAYSTIVRECFSVASRFGELVHTRGDRVLKSGCNMSDSPRQTRHEIRVPRLELRGKLRLGTWLTRLGEDVMLGERIVEIVASDVLVDLESPADGTLVEQKVNDDELVKEGQLLGIIIESPA